MATRRGQRWQLLATGVVSAGIAVVATTTGAPAQPVTLLPELPPGSALTTTVLNPDPASSLQEVHNSLTATLPGNGHAFLVIDCAGPSGSSLVVQHRDQRSWSPAGIVDDEHHADGPCQPQSERQSYALNGTAGEVVILDITGSPVTAYRVAVSDTRP